MMENCKICTECKQIKAIDMFAKNKNSVGGRKNLCKTCANERTRNSSHKLFLINRERRLGLRKIYGKNHMEQHRISSRKYRLKHKDQVKNWNLTHYYGISLNEYKSLLAEQNGKCKICGIQLDEKGGKMIKPHVDHCHSTGKVRGILCSRCNTAIGYLKDSPKIIKSALKYVKS